MPGVPSRYLALTGSDPQKGVTAMASIATLSLPIDALSDTTLAAIWKDIDAAWGKPLGRTRLICAPSVMSP